MSDIEIISLTSTTCNYRGLDIVPHYRRTYKESIEKFSVVQIIDSEQIAKSNIIAVVYGADQASLIVDYLKTIGTMESDRSVYIEYIYEKYNNSNYSDTFINPEAFGGTLDSQDITIFNNREYYMYIGIKTVFESQIRSTSPNWNVCATIYSDLRRHISDIIQRDLTKK